MTAQPFIGIDFGTCNSSVAWFNPRTGQAEPLLNSEGEDKTPSVVYFGPSEILVGRYAEERLDHAEGRKHVLTAVKRELARPRVWMLGERRITPVEAAAEIIKKLKRDAEEGHFHTQVNRAVITCPAAFDEAEKDKLREAARCAGFAEIELLEEPVAAALAYAQAGVGVGRLVLVYDLGGGTFDVALLVQDDGEQTFRLAMEPRGERLGGEEFDQAIYDHFDRLVQDKLKRPLCADGIDLAFRRQCRRWKETLSVSERTQPCNWRVPELGTLNNLHITRARLEGLIGDPVNRTIALTQAVRDDAVRAGFVVDTVILIGGSSRVPLILRRLQETLGIEPRKWQKQDVAVALGAAWHAQSLWGAPAAPAAPTEAPRSSASAPPPLPSEPAAEARSLLTRAQAAFQAALQSPGKGDAQKRRLEKIEEALRYTQAACDLEPRWADAVELKGRILQERGEWLLAAAAYTAAIRLHDDATEAYRGRAFCRLMTADYGGARQDYGEAINRAPIEADYRGRAVAHLRLGAAADAVADLERALATNDPATPRAALHAIHGLLLRDELGAADKAVAAFGAALRALPLAASPAAPSFDATCDLFGVTERLRAGKPGDSSADALYARVAALQKALWHVCKTVQHGGTRAAVAEFLAHCAAEIDPAIWKGEPAFALHAASLSAERTDATQAVLWLGRLLKANPDFEIRQAQGDPWIGKLAAPPLTAFLTPRLVHAEQHGMVFNHLTVSNRSPFRVTAVVVTVTIEHGDGTRGEPIVQHIAALKAGGVQRWDRFFKNTALFGGNIRTVHVEVACAEDPPRANEEVLVLELADNQPDVQEDIFVLTPAHTPPVVTLAPPPATSTCPRCGFVGRPGPWPCPECGFKRR